MTTPSRQSLRTLSATPVSWANLRGSFHWSLLNNDEWGSFQPRFGLASVDYTTFARAIEPGGPWLRAVASTYGGTL